MINKWPKESVGHLMIDKKFIPTTTPNKTAQQTLKELKTTISSKKNITYIYVVNECKKLIGIISFKELFKANPETKISAIMEKKVISISPEKDQEKLIYLALRHSLKAVPVADQTNHFLGIVPSRKIFTIIYKEAHEDIIHLAGLCKKQKIFESVMETSLLQSLKNRLPWLLIGLFGGMLTAHIIRSFTWVLESNIILASFIPLIAYMSGIVVTQMEAFVVRDLAMQNGKLKFKKYLFRQFTITMLVAILCGITLFTMLNIFFQAPHVAFVISFSMVLGISSSVITGLIVPYMFYKNKIDPALASGPLAALLQDLISISIYFSVAAILL